MSEVFLGQVMLFAGNFAPKGFAICAGQLISISQNTALFSLLGTNYGGNGQTTFGLPNLQSQAAVNQGQGPGLTSYVVGQTGGSPTVTLTTGDTPAHSHAFVANTAVGTTQGGSGNVFATAQGGTKGASAVANFYSPNANKATTALAPTEVTIAGSSAPHNNMQPYLPIVMCIAMMGVFPPRS